MVLSEAERNENLIRSCEMNKRRRLATELDKEKSRSKRVSDLLNYAKQIRLLFPEVDSDQRKQFELEWKVALDAEILPFFREKQNLDQVDALTASGPLTEMTNAEDSLENVDLNSASDSDTE